MKFGATPAIIHATDDHAALAEAIPRHRIPPPPAPRVRATLGGWRFALTCTSRGNFHRRDTNETPAPVNSHNILIFR